MIKPQVKMGPSTRHVDNSGQRSPRYYENLKAQQLRLFATPIPLAFHQMMLEKPRDDIPDIP